MVLIAGCAGTGTGSREEGKPTDFDKEVYQEISLSILSGNVEKAIEEFEDARRESPGSLAQTLAYTRLLIAGRQYDQAESLLLEVVETRPETAAAWFQLSLCAGVAGETSRQLEYLENAMELEPDNPEFLAAYGEIMLGKRKYSKARAAFVDCLKKETDNIVALMGLGNVNMRTGRYERAEKAFDLVNKLHPDYAFAYVDRSRVAAATGEWDAAENYLSSAIERMPEYYWNYIDRGRIRARLGMNDKAIEDYTEAIEIDPEQFIAYAYRAPLYDQRDEYEKALGDFEKVIERKPGYHEAYPRYAILLFMDENYKKAAVYFDKAAKNFPEVYEYPLMAAVSLNKTDKSDYAVTYLNKHLPNIPRESVFFDVYRFYIEKGSDLYVLGKIKAVEDEILRERMLFYLAEYYLVNGLPDSAMKIFLDLTDRRNAGYLEFRLADWESGQLME